jgi:hypothetical protein
MNNKTIRAFEVLTVEELELLAVIGSLHATTDKREFDLGRFARRRLATARRLEASAATGDAEEARRLRLAAQVSLEEAGYIARCHDDGEDPSVTHERIRKNPLRIAFAVAEAASAELEQAWADAHASGRPLSEAIGPFVRIRDGDFTLESAELSHVLTNAWGEGRPFSEVVQRFSPTRRVKGRLIRATTPVGCREHTGVTTSLSEPDEQGQADPDDDPAEATAANTAGAAGAEDRPDRSESAEARRQAAYDDGDRRRDEDGADDQRAARADRRTCSAKEAESACDDDEATAQDPDATTVAEEQLDDAQWLAAFPIRQELADPTAFDREALLWRRISPEVERMIRRIEAGRPGLLEEVAEGAFPLCWYAPVLMTVIRWPHPATWYVCRNCRGRGRKGRQKETCFPCIGTGYLYDTWLERTAGLGRR